MVTDDVANGEGDWADEDSRELIGVDIGVIGVAAARTVGPPHSPHLPRSSWQAMEDYVALINDRAAMRAAPLPLSTGDVDTVASAITGHPARLSAAFVVGLQASQSEAVQRRVAEAAGPLVIAEVDAVTAALAAAVMVTLRSREVQPQRARVAMADAESAPLLGPTLIACGIGELTRWHQRDAQDYPLTRLIEHNDVVIFPKPAAPMLVAWERTVTLSHDPFKFGGLVLPGLLDALCGHGVPALEIEHLAAAAYAVSLITPAGQVLPELDEPQLVTIARHVSQTLTGRHR